MNSNEVAVFSDNLDLLERICAMAERIESGPGNLPPPPIQLTKSKMLEIRKVGRTFSLQIVDHETADPYGPFYDAAYYKD